MTRAAGAALGADARLPRAGASLGVVTPTLQVGAVAGLLVCHAVRAAARAAGYAGAPASLPVYGVVGAGAALSGCLRYRATAVLIAVEATGAWSLVLPVVIAVFFAELAADRLSTGLFDAYLHLACMPVLADPVAAPAVAHERLDVSGVMAAGVRALPPVVAVADAAAALADTAFSARPSAFCRRNGTACARRADAGAPRQTFPVTDEPEAAARPGADFCVLGTVERRTLLTLLAHRVGLVAGPGGAVRLPADDAGWEALSRALEPRPPGADAAADQAAVLGGLGTGDRRAWLDLRPFMARAPLLVPAGASLTRALLLFRGLGLRHLLVAPEHPRAVGLVTRADLTLENAQLAMATRRPTAACR